MHYLRASDIFDKNYGLLHDNLLICSVNLPRKTFLNFTE